ncbi:ABC-type transport auxiliary lipoprotein family protein [Undibacterium sp. Ji22W]|uniref:ABC-type transport auxiliary lipoprotein family protein n=1 Tax=Undibacterium sp. Ji22W TaxID=3413038 RepID=UPI003BEFBB95
MNNFIISRLISARYKSGMILIGAVHVLVGCSLLAVDKVEPMSVYSLGQLAQVAEPDRRAHNQNGSSAPDAPTILLSMPRAAAGFETTQIAYVRQAFQLEYFGLSQWVAPPAVMLLPLISTALERSGEFKAVLQSPSRASGQLRLDMEIIRLQQEFFKVPSQVHLTVRVHLIDSTNRQVIAWQEFDGMLAATSEDPYGGVVAANQLVRLVAYEVADFCVKAYRQKVSRVAIGKK